LRRVPRRRTLVAGINDPSTIGGLRAFEECGRSSHCAAIGFNASIEARSEMRRPGSRLIGSVAYFPERYGEEIIALALRILEGRPTPPAVYMKQKLVTPENVDKVYPNDALLPSSQP
jgi:ribose transport system substrate-binding protein